MDTPWESTSEQPASCAGASGGGTEQNKPDTNLETEIKLPKSLFNTAQNMLRLQEPLTQPKPSLKSKEKLSRTQQE